MWLQIRLFSAIAVLTCLGYPGRAWAQGGYEEIATRSSALSAEKRLEARRLFGTGFELWQAGDCAAAVLAIEQGLTLDPANAQANYYHGDCLLKLRRREEAVEAFRRASALGAGTAEGFKARAALEEAAKTPSSLTDMSAAELSAALVGRWEVTPVSIFGSSIAMEIVSISGTNLLLRGSYNLAGCAFERGEIKGNELIWHVGNCSHQWRGRYTGPGRIEGAWTHGTFTAARQ